MTNSASSIFVFLVAGLIIAAVTVLAVPGFASAATFAYVNTAGEVQTVTANEPMTAINIAPNIAVHSGVLLLDSTEDNEVIGDNVSGI